MMRCRIPLVRSAAAFHERLGRSRYCKRTAGRSLDLRKDFCNRERALCTWRRVFLRQIEELLRELAVLCRCASQRLFKGAALLYGLS